MSQALAPLGFVNSWYTKDYFFFSSLTLLTLFAENETSPNLPGNATILQSDMKTQIFCKSASILHLRSLELSSGHKCGNHSILNPRQQDLSPTAWRKQQPLGLVNGRAGFAPVPHGKTGISWITLSILKFCGRGVTLPIQFCLSDWNKTQL